MSINWRLNVSFVTFLLCRHFIHAERRFEKGTLSRQYLVDQTEENMQAKMIRMFFSLSLLVFYSMTPSIAQTNKCEVLYTTVDVQPGYDGGSEALMD